MVKEPGTKANQLGGWSQEKVPVFRSRVMIMQMPAGEKQRGETLEGLRKARRTRRMFGRTIYVTETGNQWISDGGS